MRQGDMTKTEKEIDKSWGPRGDNRRRSPEQPLVWLGRPKYDHGYARERRRVRFLGC